MRAVDAIKTHYNIEDIINPKNEISKVSMYVSKITENKSLNLSCK